MTMKLLDFEALETKGVRFSDTHLRRLIRAGKFPKPIKIGCRDHWDEAEIDQHISDQLAQRDTQKEQ
jgi:predicted DNA-binding transcriptional regulator AlpA